MTFTSQGQALLLPSFLEALPTLSEPQYSLLWKEGESHCPAHLSGELGYEMGWGWPTSHTGAFRPPSRGHYHLGVGIQVKEGQRRQDPTPGLAPDPQTGPVASSYLAMAEVTGPLLGSEQCAPLPGRASTWV